MKTEKHTKRKLCVVGCDEPGVSPIFFTTVNLNERIKKQVLSYIRNAYSSNYHLVLMFVLPSAHTLTNPHFRFEGSPEKHSLKINKVE